MIIIFYLEGGVISIGPRHHGVPVHDVVVANFSHDNIHSLFRIHSQPTRNNHSSCSTIRASASAADIQRATFL
jgi:hypothetical protein